MICPFCHAALPDQTYMCRHCRTNIPADLVARASAGEVLAVDPTTAGVLCLRCHTVGWPKHVAAGSSLLEIVLWLCWILPGIIYHYYRRQQSYAGCGSCGSREVIPASSPRALEVLAGLARA